MAGSAAALQPSLRAEPPERRKRGTPAPREKKALGSRYNPNVQVRKPDNAPGPQLSAADNRQQHTERPADQCPESSAGATGAAGDVAQVALPTLPKLDMANIGRAECGPDEEAESFKLANFLAAAEVREQRSCHLSRTDTEQPAECIRPRV
eukprot:COSAG02_NODE_27965_length_599_cov_0.828000_2_plen_150_part_01